MPPRRHSTRDDWDGTAVTMPHLFDLLEEQGYHVMRLSETHARVENLTPGVPNSHLEFAVWDNGGEIGVEEVNRRTREERAAGTGRDERQGRTYLAQFAPSTYFSMQVGPLALFSRVVTLLKGEEIDYSDEALKVERSLDPITPPRPEPDRDRLHGIYPAEESMRYFGSDRGLAP